MAAKKRSKSRKAPWNRPAPRKARHTRLSTAKKQSAKARAKRAGRPYPNLVDNMRAAAGGKTKTKAKRPARKKSAKKK